MTSHSIPSVSLPFRSRFSLPRGTRAWALLLALTGVVGGGCSTSSTEARSTPTVKLTRLSDRVQIDVEGKPFTEYLFGSASARPFLYPLLAADGTKLTRDFPMANVPGEEQDHPHHRSVWFGHGIVNGTDFWLEFERDNTTPSSKAGKIIQESFEETSSGQVGVLRAKRRWEAPGGQVVARDDLTVRVQAIPEGRLLDYEITLHAPANAPLTLGDTKEGSMAVRVPLWMTLTHKFKGKEVVSGGRLMDSEGREGGNVWGKRAAWADYSAERNGKRYGISIFDHPQNPRHPTWWHARDYGLFAANPFGRHDFENLKDQPNIGDMIVPAGGKVTFRYRLYIHEGDTSRAAIVQRYQAYSAGK